MDRRMGIILVGCVVCSVLIALLFLVVVSISHKTCEPIHLDTRRHREATLADWFSSKPLRTSDRSSLLKIAAYLEYDLEPDEPTNSTEVKPARTGGTSTTTPRPVGPLRIRDLRTNSKAGFATGRSDLPRFVPLKLIDVEVAPTDDEHKFEYKLKFNCSQVSMTVSRGPKRVTVEEMHVELSQRNKRHSRCAIEFDRANPFVDVELNPEDGLARLYCDKELRFSCIHHSKQHPTRSGLLLATLVVNGIEFETGNATGATRHKNREFQGAKRFC